MSAVRRLPEQGPVNPLVQDVHHCSGRQPPPQRPRDLLRRSGQLVLDQVAQPRQASQPPRLRPDRPRPRAPGAPPTPGSHRARNCRDSRETVEGPTQPGDPSPHRFTGDQATGNLLPLFGSRGRDPDTCWCQRFRHPDEPDSRAALRREIDSSTVPIGLVAYVDADPAGWTRVVPRHTLPGVRDNRALRRLLEDDPTAWWVTCLAVRRDHRRVGVGVAPLHAAVEHAGAHQATVPDGHPVDVDLLKATPSASALFTGVRPCSPPPGSRRSAAPTPADPSCGDGSSPEPVQSIPRRGPPPRAIRSAVRGRCAHLG